MHDPDDARLSPPATTSMPSGRVALLGLAAVLCLAAPATLAACGDDSCADTGTCVTPGGADGDAGPGGKDGDADGNVPVDPCITNPTDPACIKEDEAFFVSASSGDDTAALGTKAKPFKTLTAALTKVSANKKRFYICDGTYDEDVLLAAAHNGVSLFGGVSCEWKASPNKPAFGKTNLALKVDAAKGVAIADIAFSAKDAAPASPSSIAALVTQGASVTFLRVALAAGKGAAPAPATAADFTFPSQTELNGVDGAAGAAKKTVTCPGGAVTEGGKGGASGVPGDPGTPGPANQGLSSNCALDGTGKDGLPGVHAAPPPALTDTGELTADGWTPRAGIDGLKGAPAQGGGGGYGSGGAGFFGGGGGAGGCGGAGGKGGSGGGASIALASFNATVTINESSLNAADAANAADGLAGQLGQLPGGNRGAGSGTSCNGGNGVNGGNGAGGGGGAGGVSVGVLYKGTLPTLDPASSAATTTGKKGVGGPGGAGSPAGLEGINPPTLKSN